MEVGINQGNVRLAFFQFADGLSETIGNSDDNDVVAPAHKSIRNQVRAHAVRVRNEDTDARGERLWQLTHSLPRVVKSERRRLYEIAT